MPTDPTSPSLLFQLLLLLEQAMVPSAAAIRVVMLTVFGVLLTLQVGAMGIQFLRGRSIWEELFWVVLRSSLVIWLLYNYSDMLEGAIRWAGLLGLSANGSAISIAQFLDPGELIKMGLRGGRGLYRLYAAATGLRGLGLSLVWFLCWLGYVAAFSCMALNLLRWEAEALLAAVWGLVTIPFLVYRQTTWIGQGAVNFLVNMACKFGLAGLLVSVLFSFERLVTVPDTIGLEGAVILILGVWFIAGLFFSVNRLASALVQGIPSLAGSHLIGAAVATVAGTAAVLGGGTALVAGSAGLTGRAALATARQLSGTLAARRAGESPLGALRHARQYVQESSRAGRVSGAVSHFGSRQAHQSLRHAMQVARYAGGSDTPHGGISA
jgi:type IV secretion system protein TrbL